jgi:hypothetical protein
VVDGGRKVTEEPLEGNRIRRVKSRGAQRVDLARGALEGLGIPAGEDQLGTLGVCSPGGFEPDAGATAMTTTVCPRSSGSRRIGKAGVAVLMSPLIRSR